MKKFNQKYTLSDIINNGFIFKKMVNLDNSLNFVTSENYQELDIYYYTAHAERKYMSNTVEELLQEETDGTIADALTMVAKILLANFGVKWTKMYSVLNAEYNALNDIDYTETETPNLTEATNIDTMTESSGDNSGNLYGFNSELETPANTTYSQVNNHNTADAESNFKTKTGTITRQKVGSLGDKSSLVQKELDIRKNMLYNIIYSDIDSIMTLPIWQ